MNENFNMATVLNASTPSNKNPSGKPSKGRRTRGVARKTTSMATTRKPSIKTEQETKRVNLVNVQLEKQQEEQQDADSSQTKDDAGDAQPSSSTSADASGGIIPTTNDELATASGKISGKIFYVSQYTKTEGVRWPVPRGGPLSFFTTWNMIGAVGVSGLALLTIPWLRIWPITQKIAAFTIVPLSIAVIGLICATAIVSQMLFAFNTRVERPVHEPDEHKGKPLCVSIDFIQSMLGYNFVFHLGPLVFAVFLTLAITFIPAPSTILGRSAVFLVALLYMTIICVAWLVTPSNISPEESKETGLSQDEEGEPCTGINKINRIYRDPPLWYMGVMFPGIAVLTALFAAYVLYGACMSLGFQGF